MIGRRPELDGVRGIAILLVVAAHSIYWSPLRGDWSGGTLGVDLFFVLSGFLITSLLLGEWSSRGSICLRAFYLRRARRLFPALFALVAIALLAEIGSEPGRALLTALVRVSYAANFFNTFAPAWLGTGFGHLWSLAEEEQFYLVWPLALLVLLRRGARPSRLVVVLAAAVVVVNVDRALLVADGAAWTRLWNAPDTHADPILLGCLAGVVHVHRLVPAAVLKPLGVPAAAVMVAAVALFGPDPVAIAVVVPVFGVAAAVFLLAAVEAGGAPATRLLRARPLVGLGEVSYGLYLWHLPLLAAFGIAGLPLAGVACLISYRYVEMPFRRRGMHVARAAADRTGGLGVPLTPEELSVQTASG